MGLFISFWLFPLLALLLLVGLAGFADPFPSGSFLLWSVTGVLTWTIMEYAFHRLLFHWQPRNPAVRRFLARLHLSHHGNPRDSRQLLVRPRYSLPISGLLLALWGFTLGWVPAVGMILGAWAGFLYYEAVHYRIHLSKKSGKILSWQRRWHFYHHFIDDNYCFGVTNPVWDWVFGTYRSVQRVPEDSR